MTNRALVKIHKSWVPVNYNDEFIMLTKMDVKIKPAHGDEFQIRDNKHRVIDVKFMRSNGMEKDKFFFVARDMSECWRPANLILSEMR